MRPNGALGSMKIAPIFGHVHVIITQHALIYSVNYLGKKFF